jgi:hypothetical protein
MHIASSPCTDGAAATDPGGMTAGPCKPLMMMLTTQPSDVGLTCGACHVLQPASLMFEIEWWNYAAAAQWSRGTRCWYQCAVACPMSAALSCAVLTYCSVAPAPAMPVVHGRRTYHLARQQHGHILKTTR